MSQPECKCCNRSGVMAWFFHAICIVVSSAFSAINITLLSVSLLSYFTKEPTEISPMKTFMKKHMTALLNLKIVPVEDIVGEFEPALVSEYGLVTVLYFVVITAACTCSVSSLVFSVMFLVSPRLHYAVYLPTWAYTGLLLIDVPIVVYIVVNDLMEKKAFTALMMAAASSLATWVYLFFIHMSATITMSKRDKGERSCCLPWNVDENGDIQCC